MLTKLKRVGDDLVLLFDPEFAAERGMVENSLVKVTVRDGGICVEPLGDSSGDHPGTPAPDSDNPAT